MSSWIHVSKINKKINEPYFLVKKYKEIKQCEEVIDVFDYSDIFRDAITELYVTDSNKKIESAILYTRNRTYVLFQYDNIWKNNNIVFPIFKNEPTIIKIVTKGSKDKPKLYITNLTYKHVHKNKT